MLKREIARSMVWCLLAGGLCLWEASFSGGSNALLAYSLVVSGYEGMFI